MKMKKLSKNKAGIIARKIYRSLKEKGHHHKTTGVLQTNTEIGCWWWEELDVDGIDITFEEHCRECEGDEDGYHDNCWSSDGTETRLLGFKLNDNDEYEEDISQMFSSITTECYTQVTRSKYIMLGNMCSPCFPGQVEYSNPGNILGYTLPSEHLVCPMCDRELEETDSITVYKYRVPFCTCGEWDTFGFEDYIDEQNSLKDIKLTLYSDNGEISEILMPNTMGDLTSVLRVKHIKERVKADKFKLVINGVLKGGHEI